MVDNRRGVLGNNGWPNFWWAALPGVPAARDSEAYRRLRVIWGDQTRFRGRDEARCGEFVADHFETNLMVTLWENFALFSPSLWVPELARVCSLGAELNSIAKCRWSYGWASEQPRAIIDIIVHFQTESGEKGLFVVEAKRPKGELKPKDLDPRNYLDLPGLKDAAPADRRWLIYCVDSSDKPKVEKALAGKDARARVMTWQQLGGLQISLVEDLPLEPIYKSFIAGAIQYQYAQHDLRPSRLSAAYLEEEPTMEQVDAANGGRGTKDYPPTAELWRLGKSATMRAKVPGRAECDALLRFLPTFQAPGFVFGKYEGKAGELAYPTLAPEAMAFLDALQEHGWLEPFDWPEWQEKAEELVEDATKLATADLATLKKLLTLHVRKERFCSGHILDMFERGHIVGILKRMDAIVRTAARAPSTPSTR
jgi:hypothetical protein